MTTTNALMKTGQRKVVKRLTTKVRRLMDLVLPYLDAAENVDWDRLDAENPNWEKYFPNRKWARSAVARFKGSGRFKFEKRQLTGTASGLDTNTAELSESSRVILRAYNEYGRTGHNGKIVVNWKLAMSDHPEWLDDLCYGNHRKTKNTTRASQHLYDLERKGFINRRQPNQNKALVPLNGHQPPATPEPEPQIEVTEAEREEFIATRIHEEGVRQAAARMKEFYQRMAFCPQCGNPLHAHFEAAMARRKTT